MESNRSPEYYSMGAMQALEIRDGIWGWIDTRDEGLLGTGVPEWMNKEQRHRAILYSLKGKRETITPVLWRDELWDAGRAGYEAFAGMPITRDYVMDQQPQLWLFEGIHIMRSGSKLELPELSLMIGQLVFASRGVAVEEGRASGYSGRFGLVIGWVFLEWEEEGEERYIRFDKPPIFRFMPSLFEGDLVPNATWYTEFWALRHFMDSELVEVADERLPRPMRRRYQKAGAAVPEVKTILLRRRQRTSSDESSRADREWQCQWFVGGHWRKQWKGPGAERHIEPTYVRPYLKGPADKPLKPPSKTVVKVTR